MSVEVFRCQAISIMVSLWPQQVIFIIPRSWWPTYLPQNHLIWELSWPNAYICHNKCGHIKRSLGHQLAGYSRWDSAIDETWRTVNKEQIYKRAHWSLNTVVGIFWMLLIHRYRHLRFVDLSVINGNSLMAVACIYLHRRHSLSYAQHASSFVSRHWHRPLRKRWKRCHQELCMPCHPFHRQLHSNILSSSTQLINAIILYSLLHNS